MTAGVARGPDGRLRCPWGNTSADYRRYHDDEWGRPIRHDNGLYERLTLEAFQSGLSWLTILRKRTNFRDAFAGFDIVTVAGFGEADRERLMADTGIVRNAAKIDAALANARVAMTLDKPLTDVIWAYSPGSQQSAPMTLADVPASTDASTALAKDLKRRGFRFVGPTTAYALMQAAGLVNDHLADCCARDAGSCDSPRRDHWKDTR
ncbi:MAG: DNA-3-methyladenine glycosylase I [Propionibacteriales bacterium]|nr:DNA-3-methyladenine glycosylase I [Propionibacteriales bacterium]